MGLFEKIFKRPSMQDIRGYFKMLSGYTPIFTTYEGGVYEMELRQYTVQPTQQAKAGNKTPESPETTVQA